jgi:pimeloyl-ACP methyl ester carboxylesterase
LGVERVERRAVGADAPTVVFVHGQMDSGKSFGRVIEELGPDFTTVTYDRRGWGRSRHLLAATTLGDHAHDLIAATAGRRVTIVGHSYGGTVALLAATLRPDLVASLAVFEPILTWAEWWPDPETIAEQFANMGEPLDAGMDAQPRVSADVRAQDRALVFEELAMIAEAPFTFDALDVPRVVGCSTLTMPFHVESASRLARRLAAGVVVIDKAGHSAHRSQPCAFADFTRKAIDLAGDPSRRTPERSTHN